MQFNLGSMAMASLNDDLDFDLDLIDLETYEPKEPRDRPEMEFLDNVIPSHLIGKTIAGISDLDSDELCIRFTDNTYVLLCVGRISKSDGYGRYSENAIRSRDCHVLGIECQLMDAGVISEQEYFDNIAKHQAKEKARIAQAKLDLKEKEEAELLRQYQMLKKKFGNA